MSEVFVHAEARDWEQQATDWIAARLAAALEERPRASLALAGGSTPAAVYRRLAQVDLDWTRVDLFLGDERCVPHDHVDANARLARETLVMPLGSGAPRLHLPEGIERDPQQAARDYEAALPGRLDVCLIGMGPDGHVASLFPGHPALEETERRVMVVTDSPKPPPTRISLSFGAIAASRHVVVLVRGAEKAPAVARALASEGSLERTPARIAREGTWFLDGDAASQLGRTE